jgi:hypothetical protein
MSYLWFAAGFITCYLIIEFAKLLIIKESFLRIEKISLLGVMYLLQYKFQALEILRIAYERAAEEDPKYLQEYKQVINKVEEKFNFFGDSWVKNMQSIIPYDLEYKSWKEAIEHSNKLFTNKQIRKP